ncbi:DUF6114 domain-containing protein [Nocardioides sp. Kera G14]|uniref:DUF6114 domain-containing protein n=1 Tax=Nocardioides sp. Kera G14 TaxID=2884264 RepID=UPI001D0F9061|nr:DUF6114 domain-containing protein [Nocardioides sp. Kera G14]UDY23203.1 DUF6114 domain-containing protein [Nocardioides sp. Kera G14]
MSSTTTSNIPTRARAILREARLVFRAWRRTRPFWGGLLTMLAGVWIIRAMRFSIGIALTSNWPYIAGFLVGGGLVLFGLVAWFAPIYRGLLGLLCLALSLLAFPMANLGGYLIGSVVGIFGSSMIWSWGEKRPRGMRRSSEER